MASERVFRRAVLDHLLRNGALTSAEIANHFGCSVRTIFLKLEGSGYLRSYNRNGAMLAHPDAADFDADGLWEYRGARFSVWRDLFSTIVALVDLKGPGVSKAQLQHLLCHHDIRHHLLTCVRDGHLVRIGKPGDYLYFSGSERYGRLEATRSHGTERTRPLLDTAATRLVSALRCCGVRPDGVIAALAAEGVLVDRRQQRIPREEYSGILHGPGPPMSKH